MNLNSRNRTVSNFLRRKGHLKIKHIQICRTPVTRMIQTIANFLTKGRVNQLKRKYSYDELYHLFGIMTMDNNERYIIEKNQLVNIQPFKKMPKKAECKQYGVPDIEFSKVWNQLESNYSNLYRYRAYKDNCQLFLSKFTKLLNINADDFIMQDIEGTIRHIQKTSQILTDTAAISQRILGRGNEKSLLQKKIILKKRVYI